MARSIGSTGDGETGPFDFQTTSWNLVLTSAGEGEAAQEAFAALYRTYWYPLYAHARRRGQTDPDAKDAVQELFLRFLEKNSMASATQHKGRFRTFMLCSLDHLITSEWRKEKTQKRGGGLQFVPFDGTDAQERFASDAASAGTSVDQYERDWALAVLEEVMKKLSSEWSDHPEVFNELRMFLSGEKAAQTEVAKRLGMEAGALRTTIYRLRKRYGDLIRREIASTVTDPRDVEDEIRVLFAALG